MNPRNRFLTGALTFTLFITSCAEKAMPWFPTLVMRMTPEAASQFANFGDNAKTCTFVSNVDPDSSSYVVDVTCPSHPFNAEELVRVSGGVLRTYIPAGATAKSAQFAQDQLVNEGFKTHIEDDPVNGGYIVVIDNFEE